MQNLQSYIDGLPVQLQTKVSALTSFPSLTETIPTTVASYATITSILQQA